MCVYTVPPGLQGEHAVPSCVLSRARGAMLHACVLAAVRGKESLVSGLSKKCMYI